MTIYCISKRKVPDYGYLQHGTDKGPFWTERVTLRYVAPESWFARYEGKWRKVYFQVNRLYIVYMGDKITIQIEGV